MKGRVEIKMCYMDCSVLLRDGEMERKLGTGWSSVYHASNSLLFSGPIVSRLCAALAC